jgi:amino acid transporter
VTVARHGPQYGQEPGQPECGHLVILGFRDQLGQPAQALPDRDAAVHQGPAPAGPAARSPGRPAAYIFIWVLLASGSAWIIGAGQKYFSAALLASITLIVLAYLLIFPAFLALRRREPGLARPFRVPGGRWVAWLVTGLAAGWSALAAACLLWPGLGTAHPDLALPAGFAGHRAQFEILVFAPVLAVVAAVTGYCLATRRRPRRPR